jgi:hypothetical protein
MKETEGLDTYNYHTEQRRQSYSGQKKNMKQLIEKGRRRGRLLMLINIVLLLILLIVFLPRLMAGRATTSFEGYVITLEARDFAGQVLITLNIETGTNAIRADEPVMVTFFNSGDNFIPLYSEELVLPPPSDKKSVTAVLPDTALKTIEARVDFMDGAQILLISAVKEY